MLEVRNGDELLGRLYPNGGAGGLTLDGRPPAELGTKAQLAVKFLEPAPRQFDVAVQLAWVRHKGSTHLRESFGVDFDPADDGARVRLIQFASAEIPLEASRYDERIGTELPVKLTHQGKSRREALCDLSRGGAFVRTETPLPVGSELQFAIRPPGALLGFELSGKVTWIRQQGEPKGMGIAFGFRNAREEERVAKLLAKLKSGG